MVKGIVVLAILKIAMKIGNFRVGNSQVDYPYGRLLRFISGTWEV